MLFNKLAKWLIEWQNFMAHDCMCYVRNSKRVYYCLQNVVMCKKILTLYKFVFKASTKGKLGHHFDWFTNLFVRNI